MQLLGWLEPAQKLLVRRDRQPKSCLFVAIASPKVACSSRSPVHRTHVVHQMNEAELIKFGKDLGYGIADLLKIRTDYYQNKKANGYERNDRKHDEDPLSAPSHPGFDDL